jgi:hypothetical protein
MRREWAAEQMKRSAAQSEEILLSINKKIERMRQNRLAAHAQACAEAEAAGLPPPGPFDD